MIKEIRGMILPVQTFIALLLLLVFSFSSPQLSAQEATPTEGAKADDYYNEELMYLQDNDRSCHYLSLSKYDPQTSPYREGKIEFYEKETTDFRVATDRSIAIRLENEQLKISVKAGDIQFEKAIEGIDLYQYLLKMKYDGRICFNKDYTKFLVFKYTDHFFAVDANSSTKRIEFSKDELPLIYAYFNEDKDYELLITTLQNAYVWNFHSLTLTPLRNKDDFYPNLQEDDEASETYIHCGWTRNICYSVHGAFSFIKEENGSYKVLKKVDFWGAAKSDFAPDMPAYGCGESVIDCAQIRLHEREPIAE